MPHDVIMPALGMAQDTGLIVSWGKKPGEPVGADDVLLEVETDKSTMEVPAGHDGFLAEVRAEAGEDVPVGHVIAVITEEEPAETVSTGFAGTDAGESATKGPDKMSAAAETLPRPAPQRDPAPVQTDASAADGRILASPKARRLAREENLDLAVLVEAGYPQPYHVRDLAVLRTRMNQPATPDTSAPTVPAVMATPAGEITARIPAGPLDELVGMLAEGGTPEPVRPRVLAAFAAASLAEGGGLAQGLTVRAEHAPDFKPRHFADPHSGRISTLAETDDPGVLPDLIVRDLCQTPVTATRLADDETPSLSLLRTGADEIEIVFAYPPAALDASAALRFVTALAARLGQPLNHIL